MPAGCLWMPPSASCSVPKAIVDGVPVANPVGAYWDKDVQIPCGDVKLNKLMKHNMNSVNDLIVACSSISVNDVADGLDLFPDETV